MGIFDKIDQLSDQISKSVSDGIDSLLDTPGTENAADDYVPTIPQGQNRADKAAADEAYFEQFRTDDLIFEIQGNRGRFLFVYDDRCLIIVRPTVGSVLTGNSTDGEKTIFYKDCIGIQFKESRFAIGYLQIETASGLGNNGKSNFFNENTFTFEDKNALNEDKNEYVRGASQFINEHVLMNGEVTTEDQTSNAFMREVAKYITEKVAQYKRPNYSPADEIKKFKDLLDMGVITQEEFDTKKTQLLG